MQLHENGLRLFVEMRQIGLWLLINLQDERLAAKVLVKRVHPVEGVGHVDEERRVVGLMIFELAGRMRDHVERSLLLDLAQGGAEAPFLVLGRHMRLGNQCKFLVGSREGHYWFQDDSISDEVEGF